MFRACPMGGGGGARCFSAPSRADSHTVPTPKQEDSLETCSGICHNPAPHEENMNALSSLFTHIQICHRAHLPSWHLPPHWMKRIFFLYAPPTPLPVSTCFMCCVTFSHGLMDSALWQPSSLLAKANNVLYIQLKLGSHAVVCLCRCALVHSVFLCLF